MTTAATSPGLDIGTLVTQGTHLVGGEWVPAKSGGNRRGGHPPSGRPRGPAENP